MLKIYSEGNYGIIGRSHLRNRSGNQLKCISGSLQEKRALVELFHIFSSLTQNTFSLTRARGLCFVSLWLWVRRKEWVKKVNRSHMFFYVGWHTPLAVISAFVDEPASWTPLFVVQYCTVNHLYLSSTSFWHNGSQPGALSYRSRGGYKLATLSLAVDGVGLAKVQVLLWY